MQKVVFWYCYELVISKIINVVQAEYYMIDL